MAKHRARYHPLRREYSRTGAVIKEPWAWLSGKYFWLVGIFSAVLGGGYGVWQWLGNAERFPVAVIEVTAPFTFVKQEDIQTILEPFLGYSFWQLPTYKIQHVLEEVPWIATVKVQRRLPNKLTITITERQPVAYWNQDSFISAEGELFSPDKVMSQLALPYLFGPPEYSRKVFQYYLQFNRSLKKIALQVQELGLTQTGSWQMRLSNGLVLLVGQEALEERMERFVNAYNALFSQRSDRAAYVDLRYDKGLAVRWLD